MRAVETLSGKESVPWAPEKLQAIAQIGSLHCCGHAISRSTQQGFRPDDAAIPEAMVSPTLYDVGLLQGLLVKRPQGTQASHGWCGTFTTSICRLAFAGALQRYSEWRLIADRSFTKLAGCFPLELFDVPREPEFDVRRDRSD